MTQSIETKSKIKIEGLKEKYTLQEVVDLQDFAGFSSTKLFPSLDSTKPFFIKHLLKLSEEQPELAASYSELVYLHLDVMLKLSSLLFELRQSLEEGRDAVFSTTYSKIIEYKQQLATQSEMLRFF